MEKKESLLWNIIKFDKKSFDLDIEDILLKRFEDPNILEKSLIDLYDPYLLKDMDKAVKRIKKAYKNKERVIIFWDYDVDGVTSTSILIHFFKKIWLEVSYRLPHREKDWYWLKKYFIDELKKIKVSLIITVDCGTRDIESIKYAKENNIDVIVTDHHEVPEIIPKELIALINPKRKDCTYPFKHLSGAWVAYKLMMALAREYLDKDKYENYLRDSIDIAAIGTVADCMSLTGENRIIVREWLKQLKYSRSKWIRKLIEDKINTELDADIFGFTIWPKLNAAWRMDTPYKAINLILNNWKTLSKTLFEIENLNEQRKVLTRDYLIQAIKNINPKDNLLFYISKDIKHGILWIIAWRLAEEYNKPTIVLVDNWDTLVWSCRSPEFFSIIELLERNKKYLLFFWWHKQAAGFSIKRENFTNFRRDVLKELNKKSFKIQKKEIIIDKILDINEVSFRLLSKINRYKPFGMWNPKPIFMIEDFEYKSISYLWKSIDHIKFISKYWFKILWFNMWKYLSLVKKSRKIDLIFDLTEDYRMWKKNIMFRIIDLIIY